MNIDLPNTIYTKKFTDKTVLAYIPPDYTSIEDSEEPPNLKQLNIPPHIYNSAIGKQASKNPTISSPCNRLHPLHAFLLFARGFVVFSNLECC